MAPTNDKAHGGARPRISAKGAKLATILVGPGKEAFVVHQDLLTHHSPFFRAALMGRFKEANDKTVTLEEVNMEIFEFFVHWLYCQRFPGEHDAEDLLRLWTCEDDFGDTKTSNLLRLYVFCDKYDVPALKRASLDEFFDTIMVPEHCLPAVEDVCLAFDHFPESDPLLCLLVDAFCYGAIFPVWQADNIARYPPCFVAKAMHQYTEIAHGERDPKTEPELCNYHQHQTQEERTACPANQSQEE